MTLLSHEASYDVAAEVGEVAGTTVRFRTTETGGAPRGYGHHLRRVATFVGNGDVAGSHDHKSLPAASDTLDKEVLARG